jgi:DNA replication protein DnaC
MTSDINQQKLSHLLGCRVPELEAEVVARGAADNATTLAVRDFCEGPLTFCLILGGAGSGKTIAAAEALLNSKMWWGFNRENWAYSSSEARFVLASDLARLSYFDSEAQRTLGKAERYRWLVVDDVGGEFVTDTWRSNFTELVLRRNSARLKTIFTSNLPVEDFKTRYDERIVSRIRGSGVVIISGTTDLRRAMP